MASTDNKKKKTSDISGTAKSSSGRSSKGETEKNSVKNKAVNSSAKRSRTNSRKKNLSSSSVRRSKNEKSSPSSIRRSKNEKSSSSSVTRRSEERKAASRKEYIDYALYLEVILWIILGFSVLLLISFFGAGGKAGEMVSGFLFGLFGAMTYLFPFLLFFLSAFMISNSRSRIARIKTVASFFLYLILCGFMQLILVGGNRYSPGEYYEAGLQYHTGGGLSGGILVSILCPYLGTFGGAVLMGSAAIVCIILITQRSFFSGMKRGTQAIRQHAHENREERMVRQLHWQEDQEQKNQDQKNQDQKNRNSFWHRQKKDDLSTLSGSCLKEEKDNRKVTLSVLPEETDAPIRKIPAPIIAMTGISAASSQPGQPSGYVRIMDDWSGDLPEMDDLASREKGASDAEPKAMKNLRDITKVRTFARAKSIDNKVRSISFSDFNEADTGLKEVFDETNTGLSSVIDETDTDIKESINETAIGLTDRFLNEAPVDAAREEEAEKEPAGDSLSAGLSDNSEESYVSAEETKGEKKSSSRRPRSSKEEIEKNVENVEKEIEKAAAAAAPAYVFPVTDLLRRPSRGKNGTTKDDLRSTALKLQQVFDTFGVKVHITNVTCGPSVTRYELKPEMGVKVSRVLALQDDIKLNLAAEDIRIEAPIPGKDAIGIEVPNKEKTGVLMRELLDSPEYRNNPSKLCYAVGKDIAGNIIVSDIDKMPHLLVAGATGSGKSVFINTLIMSILFRAKPDEVKLILVDPKVVELGVYNDIPHLLIPVVTDPRKAAGALNWAVAEMMKRYEQFAQAGVRDLKGYNQRTEMQGDDIPEEDKAAKLPQIVIIIDELSDLMMVAGAEVEDAIVRLTQLARAAGIHLVIATQRPSVDVITGLIKANIPSRIAFSVSSGVDSRTILDTVGAERLLGNGDMLFSPRTLKQPLRVQGAFIDDSEVADVVQFIKEHNAGEQQMSMRAEKMAEVENSISSSSAGGSDTDELFAQAGRFIIEKNKASIGMLQRWFKIGFNRAARIMDQLSDAGVVGPEEGTKPRKVLMSEEEFDNYLEQN